MLRHILLLIIVSFLPALAAAQAPTQLPVQGFLTDPNGAVINGIRDLRLTLYDREREGEILFEEDIAGVMVSAGHFVVHMGKSSGTLDHTIFRDHAELWLEIVVNTDLVEPRFRLESVAYAGFAQFAGEAKKSADADALGGIAASRYVRGEQSCSSDEIVIGLNTDGTLRCAEGDVAYAKNAGALGGIAASAYVRGNQSCPGGQIIHGLNANGTLLCGDGNVDYAARAGEANSFGGVGPNGYVRSDQSCPASQIVLGVNADGTLMCAEGAVALADKSADADALGGVPASGYVRANQRCPAGQVANGLNPNGTLSCAGVNTDAATLGGIAASGFVRSNQSCPAGSVLAGFSATGAPQCTSLGSYINANCTLYFGWRDTCDGCTSGPAKVGSVTGNDCTNLAGSNGTCISADLGSDRGVRMLGINTDGDVNEDDKFFIGIRCK